MSGTERMKPRSNSGEYEPETVKNKKPAILMAVRIAGFLPISFYPLTNEGLCGEWPRQDEGLCDPLNRACLPDMDIALSFAGMQGMPPFPQVWERSVPGVSSALGLNSPMRTSPWIVYKTNSISDIQQAFHPGSPRLRPPAAGRDGGRRTPGYVFPGCPRASPVRL